MKTRLLPLLAALLLADAACAAPSPPPCPALDSAGHALPLDPPPRTSVTSAQDDAQPVPPELSEQAANIVGAFESSGADPWQAVGGQEELSVGFMQWNWATRTLVKPFLATVPPSAIDAAPEAIRPGLKVLKDLSASPDESRQAAAKGVIADWRKARDGDPVLRSGIRRSVVQAWATWLQGDDLMKVQRTLIDSQMRLAYSFARRWQLDGAPSGEAAPVDARLLAYFFDLVTFNGGRADLWREHVQRFRAGFADKAQAVESIASWLKSCEGFVSPRSVPNTRLYNAAEGVANARRWVEAMQGNADAFSDAQVDLLVFGYLRALRSVGADPPRGFPGIYQSDVLSRRGTIALGMGRVHGIEWPGQPERAAHVTSAACSTPAAATTYDEVIASGIPGTVLQKVIARDGKSKHYDDLLPLDGGTVGIAHFAVGGLGALYAEMDTQKYFSKSRETMVARYSNDCRPAGREGNDTGWGCYSQPWWREGMQQFLASGDMQGAQDRAWARLMKSAIEPALAHGWRAPRQFAIALGIANSLGSGGFRSLAARNDWDAEATLRAYAIDSDHRERRRQALDAAFPRETSCSLEMSRSE